MKKLHLALLAPLLLTLGASQPSQPLTPRQAVALAEQFLIDNGYTHTLVPGQAEVSGTELYGPLRSHQQKTDFRYNELKPQAIGLRPGRPGRAEEKSGWSVAFDYLTADPELCRIVTMNPDGSDINMQHKDGLKSYFAGFAY